MHFAPGYWNFNKRTIKTKYHEATSRIIKGDCKSGKGSSREQKTFGRTKNPCKLFVMKTSTVLGLIESALISEYLFTQLSSIGFLKTFAYRFRHE